MRTTISIDDQLMTAARAATGRSSKREIVELGLRTLVRPRRQEEIRLLRGKLRWSGDLDASCTGE